MCKEPRRDYFCSPERVWKQRKLQVKRAWSEGKESQLPLTWGIKEQEKKVLEYVWLKRGRLLLETVWYWHPKPFRWVLTVCTTEVLWQRPKLPPNTCCFYCGLLLCLCFLNHSKAFSNLHYPSTGSYVEYSQMFTCNSACSSDFKRSVASYTHVPIILRSMCDLRFKARRSF